MKIRTIALNTFGSFLRNKVILLFCSLFVCIVALMTSPLLYYKSMTSASNAQQMQGVILNTVASVISMVSGFGSLLAAWAAADSVAGEMKSGTVLAVMARPLHRWEFMARQISGRAHAHGGLCSFHAGRHIFSGVVRRPELPYPSVDAAGVSHGALCDLGSNRNVSGYFVALCFRRRHCRGSGHAGTGFWIHALLHAELDSHAGASGTSFNRLAFRRAFPQHHPSVLETLSMDQPPHRTGLRTGLCPGLVSYGSARVSVSKPVARLRGPEPFSRKQIY